MDFPPWCLFAKESTEMRASQWRSGSFLCPIDALSLFWVESRTGASASAEASSRFPAPLIKPDVPISSIRLSDWLHRKTHERGPSWTRRSRRTPNSPNITSSEKRWVPRDGTL